MRDWLTFFPSHNLKRRASLQIWSIITRHKRHKIEKTRAELPFLFYFFLKCVWTWHLNGNYFFDFLREIDALAKGSNKKVVDTEHECTTCRTHSHGERGKTQRKFQTRGKRPIFYPLDSADEISGSTKTDLRSLSSKIRRRSRANLRFYTLYVQAHPCGDWRTYFEIFISRVQAT